MCSQSSSAQIDVFKKEEAESSSKLERLDAKISDLEAQKSENLKAITMADQRITLNKNSTPAEVYRLERELSCSCSCFFYSSNGWMFCRGD